MEVHNDRLVTKLRLVQKTDEDAKWLQVMHQDAFFFPTSGLALQDPHHCLKHTHIFNDKSGNISYKANFFII